MGNLSPFDVAKDLSTTKKRLITGENEKEYVPFLVNRFFSNFYDTVRVANEMNMHADLDHLMQHDFYFHFVRKGKRFSKWFKKDKSVKLDAVRRYYNYGIDEAREAMKILTKEQLKHITDKMSPKHENV